MVARAIKFDFEWKSTIALFCDLMQSIAPNFYEQPEIVVLLETANDENFSSKIKIIADDIWEQAAAQGREVPALIPPEEDTFPVHQRALSAMSVALWDAPSEKMFDLFESAKQAVCLFDLIPTDEALLVGAGWAYFYGSQPEDLSRYRWVKDIRASHLSPATRLVALRARIMLDFKRRV